MFTKKSFKRALAGILSVTTLAASSAFTLPASAEGNSPNYGKALALSLYFFDSNACGTGITDGPLTWRGDCHTYDAEASLEGVDGSFKSLVDPDGDGKVDVSGGYHDAGDHIKFNLTIGFGLQSLALSEYLNPGVYEKAGCKDHLMYILRRGCDYLMKTTFLDGSGNVATIAHVVADGGTDHSFWSAPEVQTYPRAVFWLTAGKNNSAVCGEMAAALASTAYIFKDADAAYSAECLKYAKALSAFGHEHKGNETGGLGGFYSTDAMSEDELALADAWLWINGEGEKPKYQPKNGDYGGVGDWDKYTWDKVWQGFSALMYKATDEAVYRDELDYEHKKNGITSTAFKKDAGWGNSRYNCALQMTALSLAGDDAESEYAKAAKFQMDAILGNNSTGLCFLIGFDGKWPTKIHHRAANPGDGTQTADSNMDAKYTNYGMLVGGENNDGYLDETNKYQYTEGALDYNGCFALACAGLYRLYGGDASEAKTLAQNVSEINADFKFGEYSSTEPQPQETTTTESTTTTTTTTTSAPPFGCHPGDANCDGAVDVKDAVLIARVAGGDSTLQLQDEGRRNSDVNNDGTFDTADLTKVLRMIVGIE